MRQTRTSQGEIKILTIPLEVTNSVDIPIDFEGSINTIEAIINQKTTLNPEDGESRLKRILFQRYLGNIIKFARNFKWLANTVSSHHSNTNTYIEYPFRHINELEEYLNPNRTDESEIQSFAMSFIHNIRGSLLRLDMYCFEPILILRKLLNKRQREILQKYSMNDSSKSSLENIPNAHIFHLLKEVKSILEGAPIVPLEIAEKDEEILLEII